MGSFTALPHTLAPGLKIFRSRPEKSDFRLGISTSAFFFVAAHFAKGTDLRAPTTVQMDRRIQETLSATIDLRLEKKMRGKWVEVFSGTGNYAGLEQVGDL